MKFFDHPLWLVGFRPFFTLGFIAGVILPGTWVFIFLGKLHLQNPYLSGVQWHAHEMLYGFGWAILGGFLLTASKNWLKIRGMHGIGLAFAVFFWLIDRVSVLFFSPFSLISLLAQNLFIVYVTFYLIWTLIKFRKQDAFTDNYFFVITLVLFIVAKNLLLYLPTYALGASASVGLFRVAFLMMLGRTIPQFMKNSYATILNQNSFLEFAIKFFALAAVFCALLPPKLAFCILLILALLMLIRFALWRPLLGLKKFEIAIMYLGYFALCIHLIFEALKQYKVFIGIGSLSVHIFTIFCMGLIIPGMLIRISQGHTGRKLVFSRSDRVAIALNVFAGIFRVIATQIAPNYNHLWISIAGLCWALCFSLLAFRLMPILWVPRVDNREF